MALFEITNELDVADNVTAIMNSQMENIAELCSNYDEAPNKTVHEIRKSFKRLRAVIKLVREEVGYSSYYRENSFFRDESKLISELRDLHVFEEDLNMFRKKPDEDFDSELCDVFIEKINSYKKELFQVKTSVENVFDEIKSDISDCKARINQLQFHVRDFTCIEGGLYRNYHQGRKELTSSLNNPSVENLHNLRKKVKYLMFHIQMLSPIWPEYMKPLRKFLDNIAENLGNDHNYAVLIDYLRQNPIVAYDSSRHEDFFIWIEGRRKDVYKKALFDAERVFIGKPGVFVERIKGLWNKYNKS